MKKLFFILVPVLVISSCGKEQRKSTAEDPAKLVEKYKYLKELEAQQKELEKRIEDTQQAEAELRAKQEQFMKSNEVHSTKSHTSIVGTWNFWRMENSFLI